MPMMTFPAAPLSSDKKIKFFSISSLYAVGYRSSRYRRLFCTGRYSFRCIDRVVGAAVLFLGPE